MVKPCSTALKEREYEDDPQFSSERTELLRTWSRDGLCLVKDVDILRLAEVKSIMKLLQYNQLCTLACCSTNSLFQAVLVVSMISGVGLLDEANAKYSLIGHRSYLHLFLLMKPRGNCIVAQCRLPCW